jgi:CelD/BcsL family acetyltransferase involved in cellulose biosynthesis
MNSLPSAFSIEVLDRAMAIRRLPDELDELATRALEPNIFNESLFFIAALQLIDVDVPLWIVCIRNAGGVIQGVVPLVREPLRRGFPAKVLRNWMHRYCFLGTPILDANSAQQVLEALATWLESGAAPAGGIEWVNVGWDGPFSQLVSRTFNQSRSWVAHVATQRRAILERTTSVKSPVSGKHAKELRRLERRLAAQGDVDYSVMQPSDDWQRGYDEFLTVEASGWKGEEGSAIRSAPADRAFFSQVLQQAHARGQLQLLRLTVAGKAVAMKLNLRTRSESYSLKIGYDPAYAQFSPGILLELYNIKVFELEADGILRMDSCAAENHSMINRLWSGRREIATVTLARHGVLLRTFVRLRPVAQRLKQTLLAENKQQDQR